MYGKKDCKLPQRDRGSQKGPYVIAGRNPLGKKKKGKLAEEQIG